MRDSVPSGSYSSVCNVLRQWKSCSSLLIESTDSMINTGYKMYRIHTILIYITSRVYNNYVIIYYYVLCITD